MKKNMYDILNENQIKLKSYEGNTKTKCPKCQPPHNKNDTPLSVTCDNGNAVWNCHHCGWSGSTNTTTNFVTAREKIYVAPKIPKETSTPSTMYSWFSTRGISKETVLKKGIYIDDKFWIAFPYKDAEGAVVNIKYRTQNKKFKQSPNAKRSLYNYDLAKDSKTIIFVEGEMDALTMIEAGFDNCVTLPDGAPKECKLNPKDKRFMALENCPLKAKKVILFTDNDSAGKSLHKELLHRFGKELCWYVDYPTDCKDANEVLLKHGVKKIQEIIQNAKPYPIDGLFSAHQYYGSVLDLYNGNYVKPIEVGYDNLDEIYKVMKGTFHVVTGIPNHGKSSFLDQCLIKISEKHNWRYAMFSPEHSTQMHLRRLVQLKVQKAFDEGFVNRMTKDELQKGLEWINERFYFIETKETTPDIDYILSVAKASVLKYGCDALVIDPYNEVSAVRQGNAREDEHIRDFISKLKRFARIHDVVVWVVAHPTKLPKNTDGSYMPPTAYDISGASHWSNQSDAILTVHRDFDDNSIQVITRKIREQGLYGKIGDAKFKYNANKRIFEQDYITDSWSDTPHWTEN
jgi:twinkle protein